MIHADQTPDQHPLAGVIRSAPFLKKGRRIVRGGPADQSPPFARPTVGFGKLRSRRMTITFCNGTEAWMPERKRKGDDPETKAWGQPRWSTSRVTQPGDARR
jgi:hypothetical protein